MWSSILKHWQRHVYTTFATFCPGNNHIGKARHYTCSQAVLISYTYLCTMNSIFWKFIPRKLTWNGTEILSWSLFTFKNLNKSCRQHNWTSNIVMIILCTFTHVWFRPFCEFVQRFVLWKTLCNSNVKANRKEFLASQTGNSISVFSFMGPK